MKDPLKEIANRARVRCDDILINIYNYKENLWSACGIASYYLMMMAKKRGIYVTFCYGNFDKKFSHCWISYNGLVYDITATQFKVKEKVYITDGTRYKTDQIFKKPKYAFRMIRSWCNYPKELMEIT